jgi:CelD/BcsL family acetyltransferase involved in cellulose biosynthesis
VDDATLLPAALQRFFQLHALRARATHLSDHADYFADSPAKNLLLGLASSPQRPPALRVFELRIGTELVAARVGFELGDELYLYFSGFDPKWARYSVMTTTVAEAIKWAISRKLRVVNLSTGTDVSKTRWGGEVVTTCDGVLTSPSRRAMLKWKLSQALNDQAHSPVLLSRVVQLARRRG